MQGINRKRALRPAMKTNTLGFKYYAAVWPFIGVSVSSKKSLRQRKAKGVDSLSNEI